MTVPVPPVLPAPKRTNPDPRDGVRLPGMELLGFYDQPYQVKVTPPPTPPRAAAIVTFAPHSPRGLTPSGRVSALWDTTEVDESAMERWRPQIIRRRKLGGRRTRMSTLLTALVALVGLVFVSWSLVQRSDRAAEESLQNIGADTREFLRTLPAVEEIVSGIGNPDPPDLTLSTERILDAESSARQLFADAGAQEGSRRDQAVAAAGGVLEATGRANQLLAYRLAAERMLVVPSLPSDPAATDLPSATEAVAGWRAEIETEIDELAPDVLAGYQSALEEWLRSLDAWQGQYLDAVRQEDRQATGEAVAELEAQIVELRQGLLDELAQAGGELRSEIADARRQAERLLGE